MPRTKTQRVAVIDMGSNSFRLVVYGYDGSGSWALTDEIREAVRLSAGMGDALELRPGPWRRALDTAEAYAAFCRASGVDDVIAVGTSALRDASNARELLDEIVVRTGIDARVLSGEEEARYGAIAIANSTTIEDGFGIDVGGGSVQLMRLEGRTLADWESLPLGAVRVSEAFLPDDAATKKQIKELSAAATERIAALEWLPAKDGGRLRGIGGTIRNLAAAAQKRSGLPAMGVQGFVLTRAALGDLIDELAARPASERAEVPGIKPDRGDVILGGALVVAAAMDHSGFDELEVTEAGLREGVFFERLLADRDPPLFGDVRRDSVRNLARRFRFDPPHVDHVVALSLAIYDGLAEAGLIEPDSAGRELLWAGCVLHDIGMAVGYDDHHKHSEYLVLNAGLPGFDQREQLLVALIARYHRKGTPDVGALGSLARKGDQQLLELLAGIVRLAEQLERSRDQSVTAVRVSADGDDVRLLVDAPDNDELPLWAARRNADMLAGALGRSLAVERAA